MKNLICLDEKRLRTLALVLSTAVLFGLTGCDRGTKNKVIGGITNSTDSGGGITGGTTTDGGTTTGGTLSSTQSTAIVNQLFTGAMSTYGSAAPRPQRLAAARPVSVTVNVDETQYGPLGGNMRVTGSVTANVNEQTSVSTVQIGMTESITSYKFLVDGVTYTINGSIDVTGSFTVTSGGTFASGAYIGLGGSITVTGGGVNATVDMDVRVTFNSSGTGGTITGTIDGQTINESL